jgi:hypothetical protein
MSDTELDKISNKFKSRRKVRECLRRIPDINDRRICRYIDERYRNGIGEFAVKAGDGEIYCYVEDFIAWVERGMRPARPRKSIVKSLPSVPPSIAG